MMKAMIKCNNLKQRASFELNQSDGKKKTRINKMMNWKWMKKMIKNNQRGEEKKSDDI